MGSTTKSLLRSVLILILLFVSVNALKGQTIISTPVTGLETWTSDGNPYVINSNIIVTGDLTISTGVIVEFGGGDA